MTETEIQALQTHPDEAIAAAAKQAVEARTVAAKADHAARLGTPNADEALALERDCTVTSSACDYYERVVADLLAKKGS